MKAINHDVEEFLRVLLITVGELFLKAGNHSFESQWHDKWIVVLPQLSYDSSKRSGDKALSSQRILDVDFVNEFAFQEILPQRDAVAEAL